MDKVNKPFSTKEKIIMSGENLFSTYWYETVSIAQICRNANVSNGIYYKYFPKKVDLFRELLNKTLVIFKDEINKVEGKTQSARLKSFINIVVRIGKTNKNLITVFREGQYRFPEYERELENLYRKAINGIYNSSISNAQYMFIMSGIRFISIRSLYNNSIVNTNSIQKIIEHGIFRETLRDNKNIFVKRFPKEKIVRDPDTKTKLLNSAIKLFGQNGFHNVNVYEISRESNLSVGTFYIYFESKESCLEEIVCNIGQQTRHFISSNMPDNLNRLEQEIAGIYLFLQYFKKDINYYRIVRESEFVVKETATEYYNRFETGYLKNLKNLRINDKTTVANFLMGLSHYLGIEVYFTEKIKRTKPFLIELATILQEGIPR